MSENIPPGGAVPTGEIGRHQAFTDADISKLAAPSYADALNCDSLMGKSTLVMTFDPNKKTLERVLTNAPELRTMVDGLMQHLNLKDSALHRACDEIVGTRAAIVERGNSNEGEAQRRRLGSRHDYLERALATCKLQFGSISGAAQSNSTIEKVEETLRAYHARGNPLPRGVLRYLESADAEVRAPMPPLGSTAPEALKKLVPLVFDPVNPSSLSKRLFNLQQAGRNKPVSIKTEDGRKTAEHAGRARANLALAYIDQEAAAVGLSRQDYIAGMRGGP